MLLSGFGGMLSLRLRGGGAAAQALLDAVRLPYPAPSLGGVESLITRPGRSPRMPGCGPRTGTGSGSPMT